NRVRPPEPRRKVAASQIPTLSVAPLDSSWKRRRMRSTSATTSVGSSSSRLKANSSPPTRAAVSPLPQRSRRRVGAEASKQPIDVLLALLVVNGVEVVDVKENEREPVLCSERRK